MGTCTPKTSFNSNSNFNPSSNRYPRQSNRTSGTGTSGTSGSSGSSGNDDNQIRDYNQRRGSQQNVETKNFPIIESLPVSGPLIQIVEEQLDDKMRIKGTYNGRNKSVLGQHKNIRQTTK